MNKFTSKFIIFCIVVLAIFLGSLVLGSLIEFGTVDFNEDLFSTQYFSLIFGVGILFYIIFLLNNLTKEGKGGKDKNNGPKQFFDSKFLSEKELNKKYAFTLYSNLKNMKDGIPIRAELKRGNLHVNIKDPIHTMIIGTTGSGKTTAYIEPTIQILCEMQTKPSLVITDPKGELYAHHAYKLKKAGYDLKVLNLRDVFTSTRWNPLDRAFDYYHKSLNLQKQVKVHRDENPADFNLKVITSTYPNIWFEFEGTAYPTKQDVMTELIAKKKELESLAKEELVDIAKTLAPIENQNDPSWDMGAQNYIQGVMLAMLEDTAKPELGMTREKFNMYNVAKIALHRDNDPDDQFKSLKKYLLEGRDKMSIVSQLCGPILNNAPNTTRGYLGMVSTKLAMFSDLGVCYATSWNDMAFDTFCDKPTAFFIINPDEKETRDGIATLAITQLYKTLIEKASKLPGQRLPRNIYFVLDEFGNLPKISTLDSIITVGRSRGIFMLLVIQSYTQLNNIYGDKIADIVRTNCNIQVFIGTPDAKTKEEFSKMCGQITVKTQSESKGEKDSKSKTTSETSRPLIYPEELELLPKNTYIVKMFRENPAKVVFTPYFQALNVYDVQPLVDNEFHPSNTLNEKAVFYDIGERNRIVLGNKSDFDDFDF